MKFHNPFKLFGSYLGFFFGIPANYLMFGFLYYLAEQGRFEPWGILAFFIPPVIGFILGWLIHSAIKKSK